MQGPIVAALTCARQVRVLAACGPHQGRSPHDGSFAESEEPLESSLRSRLALEGVFRASCLGSVSTRLYI